MEQNLIPDPKCISCLLIFDFDDTLANTNLFTEFSNNKPKFEKFLDSNQSFCQTFFNDFFLMHELFTTLVTKYNFKICIASFGFQSMIEEYIKISYGFDLINKTDITGTNGIKSSTGMFTTAFSENYNIHPKYNMKVCKNSIIKKFMADNQVSSSDTIFFDDDAHNISEAVSNANGPQLPRQNTINVPKGQLQIDLVISAINKWCGTDPLNETKYNVRKYIGRSVLRKKYL